MTKVEALKLKPGDLLEDGKGKKAKVLAPAAVNPKFKDYYCVWIEVDGKEVPLGQKNGRPWVKALSEEDKNGVGGWVNYLKERGYDQHTAESISVSYFKNYGPIVEYRKKHNR